MIAEYLSDQTGAHVTGIDFIAQAVADALARTLDKAGIKSAAIHGDKSQGARTRVLSEFKDGKLVALVATDIAARGIELSPAMPGGPEVWLLGSSMWSAAAAAQTAHRPKGSFFMVFISYFSESVVLGLRRTHPPLS